MVHEKVPSNPKYWVTAIWETWKDFNKKFCFKLEKSMLQRIYTVIKLEEEY